MCFNNDSVNLLLICYFNNIKLAKGTNEYFLTTYYIWQKHTEEPNTKEHKDIEKQTKDHDHDHDHDHGHKDEENKDEVAHPLHKQPKPMCQVFY
jgi:hypothetical protein